MKYFWNKARGLKADVERHRAKEQELEELELQKLMDKNPHLPWIRENPF